MAAVILLFGSTAQTETEISENHEYVTRDSQHTPAAEVFSESKQGTPAHTHAHATQGRDLSRGTSVAHDVIPR